MYLGYFYSSRSHKCFTVFAVRLVSEGLRIPKKVCLCIYLNYAKVFLKIHNIFVNKYIENS